jgi:hypothetical protein
VAKKHTNNGFGVHGIELVSDGREREGIVGRQKYSVFVVSGIMQQMGTGGDDMTHHAVFGVSTY